MQEKVSSAPTTSCRHWFQASLSPCSLMGKVRHFSGARWLTSDGERGGRSKRQTNRACLTLLNSPTPPHWSVLPSCRSHAGLGFTDLLGDRFGETERKREAKRETETHKDRERNRETRTETERNMRGGDTDKQRLRQRAEKERDTETQRDREKAEKETETNRERSWKGSRRMGSRRVEAPQPQQTCVGPGSSSGGRGSGSEWELHPPPPRYSVGNPSPVRHSEERGRVRGWGAPLPTSSLTLPPPKEFPLSKPGRS